MAELQGKCDEQTRQLGDYGLLKGRLHGENTDLNRQLEELELQVSNLARLKSTLTSQLDEAKTMANDESRERQILAAQVRNIQHENESLREHVEEETEGKEELQRLVSKLNGEIQQWMARFEHEGMAKLEEIEEAKSET